MKKKLLSFLYLAIPLILTISCQNEDISPGQKSNATTSEPVVSTFAGSVEGDIDGKVNEAKLNFPGRIAIDNNNNLLFTDTYNHKIKKITPEGDVITIAGSGKGFKDGKAHEAMFNYPWGIAVAANGDIYISDSTRIRKITTESEVITIAGTENSGYKDGPSIHAEFNLPAGLDFGPDGSLYVADMYNNAIRKITPDGIVSTLAGSTEGDIDGSLSEARFNHPAGLAVDKEGNVLVADSWNHKVKKISVNEMVITLAGDGKTYGGNSAESILIGPMDISISKEKELFVADTRGVVIKIDTDGKTSWYAGTPDYEYADGAATEAKFGFISGLEITADGVVYVCENHRIRKIAKE